jgi:hypothetical protein
MSIFSREPAPMATPEQRLYAGRLMRRLELPSDRTCLQHKRFFNAARLPEPEPDQSVDQLLSTLTQAQASALIDVLVREVEEQT